MDTTQTTATYLDNMTEAELKQFERVQRLVNEVTPDTELVMSYGLPTFKLNGKVVVHFGAFKDHLSLFPGSAPIAELQDRLAEFKTAKGTIQFTIDRPIPDDLLHDIIAFCTQRASM
jgi:uncharacterized protein YdhG (YjbR/CyaY superfamily)